jgi:hypothetical protein
MCRHYQEFTSDKIRLVKNVSGQLSEHVTQHSTFSAQSPTCDVSMTTQVLAPDVPCSMTLMHDSSTASHVYNSLNAFFFTPIILCQLKRHEFHTQFSQTINFMPSFPKLALDFRGFANVHGKIRQQFELSI